MGAAVYLDPRIGIDAWLSGGAMDTETRTTVTGVSQLIRWASAAWILSLGLLFTFGKSVIRLYIVSECLLSVPSLAFFAMVMFSNLNSNHGFSIGELFIPVAVFAIYTVVPVSLGIKEWRSYNGQGRLEPSFRVL